MSEDYRSRLDGKTAVVLFERKVELCGGQYYLGHTAEYVEVAVQSDENLVNQMKMVQINEKITEEIRKGTCVIS
jgi:threonylcarbamoyladenosine tRNA methylthiotransferase MtaB